MAVSPEIQSLIDVLHANPRGEDWAENVTEAYDAALGSIDLSMPDVAAADVLKIKNDALQEVLRQHVDEEILPQVMEVFDQPPTEDFAEELAEKASSWPENLQVYTEEDLEGGGLRGYPEAESIDAATAGRMLEAARDGNMDAIVSALLILQQQGRDSEYTPIILSEEAIAGSLTPQGQSLFDYVKEKIYQANSQLDAVSEGIGADGNPALINNRPFTPDGGEHREGVLITLSPEEMRAMIRTEIAQDIQNGTFPIPGLDHTDAEGIADLLFEKAFTQAERTGVDVGGSGPGLDGSGTILNYAFRVKDGDLVDAIDTMFLGDDPVLDSTAQMGINEHQFAEEYTKVMDVLGGAMTADHLIEHFTNLMTDRLDETVSPPETIPAVLDIPDHMHEQFFDAIRDSYEASRRVDPDDPESLRHSFFDADVFGEKMEERFGQIDAEHSATPMNRDALDYSTAIEVTLGAETDDGFQVVNEAGEVLFEMDVSEGFALYAARNSGDHLVMDEMRGVTSKEELRELLGEEGFTVQAISPLDEGLETDGSSVAGYYIVSESTGNSFHVGFDAVPEESVSPDYKQLRDTTFDVRDAEPSVQVNPDLKLGATGVESGPDEVDPPTTEGPPPGAPPGVSI